MHKNVNWLDQGDRESLTQEISWHCFPFMYLWWKKQWKSYCKISLL